MKELQRVLIGTKTLPFRIDLNVIEEIEEKYESTEKFEQELLGWQFKRGEDGTIQKNDQGKPLTEYKQPSTKAIIFVLPIAVNEGLRVEARRNGTAFEAADPEELLEESELDPNYLREIIWQELQRCRSVKKPIPDGKAKRTRSKK